LKGLKMRTTTVRPKPMPRIRAKDGPWWPLLAWVVFSVALVAVGILLTPDVGIAYSAEGLPATPHHAAQVLQPPPGVADAAVPMADTVLLPYEPAGTPIVWVPKL
jgi:hypothetical protein